MYEEIQARPVLIPCVEKGRLGVEAGLDQRGGGSGVGGGALPRSQADAPFRFYRDTREIVVLLEESKTIGNRSIDEIEEALVVKWKKTSVQQQM